jgi:polyisoprenoid-binding protein YceI
MKLAGIGIVMLALGAGAAHAETTLSVDTGASALTFYMVHKLHKFDGSSKQLSGKAKILDNGTAQVLVSAPSQSFDSKNANRDEHLKETIEAARFPTVELKALCEGVTLPATFPSTVDKKCKGQITFHGVTNATEVPVSLTFESATRIKANAKFSLSLDAFKIERPSLMFVKVDDDMKLDATVVFKQ